MVEQTMKVVLLEPGRQARAAEIDASLEGMQEVVGGSIEACYPFAEAVCLICNEEGKLNGMPLNRALRDERGKIWDIIAGPCFLCDCSGEDFGSLSEEQITRYRHQFLRPEKFFRWGDEIIALPYTPGEPERQER